MSFVRLIALLLILECTDASLGSAQQGRTPQPLPIIDMHIHAFSWNHQGNPPPPDPVTGKVPTARTDNEAMEGSLAELRRYNVVRAVAGGPREHVLRQQHLHACRPRQVAELVVRTLGQHHVNVLERVQ